MSLGADRKKLLIAVTQDGCPLEVAREASTEKLLEMVLPERETGTNGKLSDREIEVVRLYATGLPTRDIARQLCRSIKTIESHRAHIKAKMQIKTGMEWMQLLRQFPVEA